MGVTSNTVLALSMSADAFAVAVSKGTTLRTTKITHAMKIGAIFGVVEAITPVIGWCLGTIASRFIESIDHWIAFILLSAIGCKMIFEGTTQHQEQRKNPRPHLLFLTAIGTSMDALAVGITLAIINADILLIAIMIGTATFVMTTIGIMAGRYIGNKAGKIAEIAGGLCLITIGGNILVTHLGLL